jgi:hypothetical protein
MNIGVFITSSIRLVFLKSADGLSVISILRPGGRIVTKSFYISYLKNYFLSTFFNARHLAPTPLTKENESENMGQKTLYLVALLP